MKRFAVLALFAAAALVGCVAAGPQVGVNVTIGGFYDELAPYGRWVDCNYGQCWVPGQVASDWQPYSNGQWIYTEYGWTWVSRDPWGGSPYHYGTWASIPGYGWSWVPGTVWAPAWVTWSYSNSYVGWAPLPPTMAFGASGYAGSPVVVSQTQYVFVPTNRFVGGNVASVRIPAQQSAQVFGQTRPVTGFSVSDGIVRNTALPMATIERASGGKIETRSIQAAGTAPRAVTRGTTRLAVVAPPREVKAARPPAVAQPSGSSREQTAPRHPSIASPRARELRRAPDSPPPPAESRRPTAQPPEPYRQAPPRQSEVGRPVEQTSRPTPETSRDQPVERSDRERASKPTPQDLKEKPAERSDRGRPPAAKPTPQPGKEEPAEKDEKDEKPDGEKR